MRHRPWFKVVINTVLRFFQKRRRPARLWVLVSVFEDDRLIRYRFGWVVHLSGAQAPGPQTHRPRVADDLIDGSA